MKIAVLNMELMKLLLITQVALSVEGTVQYGKPIYRLTVAFADSRLGYSCRGLMPVGNPNPTNASDIFREDAIDLVIDTGVKFFSLRLMLDGVRASELTYTNVYRNQEAEIESLILMPRPDCISDAAGRQCSFVDLLSDSTVRQEMCDRASSLVLNAQSVS